MISLTTIILILLVHFISDWLLQSRSMAENKSSNMKVLLKHGCIISLPLLSLCMFLHFSILSIILISSIYFILHILQDKFIWGFYKIWYIKRNLKEYWKDYWWFSTIAIDQFIHLIILFILITFGKI